VYASFPDTKLLKSPLQFNIPCLPSTLSSLTSSRHLQRWSPAS